MSKKKRSDDWMETLDEHGKQLLAEAYPEMREKLERSIERARKKRKPVASTKPIPVFDLSSDDEKEVKKEVVSDEEIQLVDSRNQSKRSDDYSFHSARSRPDERADESKISDGTSPPRVFTADEQEPEEMDGDFVLNPRLSSSFEEIDAEEEEEESEPTQRRRASREESGDDCDDSRDDEEEEENESDSDDCASFLDDEAEESEMSIDRSFQPDVSMATPPNRRVLPTRSTRATTTTNYHTAATSRSLAPPKKKETRAEISPSHPITKREEESGEEDGEESFERYLRKLKDDDMKKKQQQKMVEEEEDEGDPQREDSFVVSDESVDVIDDDYENGSSDELEEGEQSDVCSSDDSGDKENGRRGKEEKKKERRVEGAGGGEKTTKKRDLLRELADTFDSPSLKQSTRESRDGNWHFLMSLSENYQGKRRHADAEPFMKRGVKGEKTREALVKRLFELYNREIFEEKLPADLSITFNARLRKTAGYCKHSMRTGKTSIELSPKVCSKPERIRDTLAHELCHAAVFVVNQLIKEGHGPVWRSWTAKFAARFRDFPVPSRCHSYEIEAKFVYECDGCGQLIKRHTNSFDTERKGCGRCHGRFRLLENTETKKRGANAFALYVKEQYGEEKRSGKSHKEIMQVLSAKFKLSKAGGKKVEEEEKEEQGVKRLDLDLSIMSIHEE